MRTRLSARLGHDLLVAPLDPLARVPRLDDAPALAALMLAAYRGTIDDAGEGLAEAAAEISRYFSGAYGTPDLAASDVTQRESALASATLITHFQDSPLLAFSMTAPAWKRRGLARAGLLRAMHRLRMAGHRRLRLVVTIGNTPAESLYAELNFQPDDA